MASEDRAKRRRSILKRADSTDNEITETVLKSVEKKETKRVSFARRNSIKGFMQAANNTFWESTYEESVNSNEKTPASSDNATSLFENCTDVDSKAMEITCAHDTTLSSHHFEIYVDEDDNTPADENKINTNKTKYNISDMQLTLNQLSDEDSDMHYVPQTLQPDLSAMELTCQVPVRKEDRTNLDLSTMEFTCQVPVRKEDKTKLDLSTTEFTCQVPIRMEENTTLNLSTEKFICQVPEKNDITSKDYSTMQFTCQIAEPTAINDSSINRAVDKVNKTFKNSSSMQFTSQLFEKFNTTMKQDLAETLLPEARAMPTSMEFTCQVTENTTTNFEGPEKAISDNNPDVETMRQEISLKKSLEVSYRLEQVCNKSSRHNASVLENKENEQNFNEIKENIKPIVEEAKPEISNIKSIEEIKENIQPAVELQVAKSVVFEDNKENVEQMLIDDRILKTIPSSHCNNRTFVKDSNVVEKNENAVCQLNNDECVSSNANVLFTQKIGGNAIVDSPSSSFHVTLPTSTIIEVDNTQDLIHCTYTLSNSDKKVEENPKVGEHDSMQMSTECFEMRTAPVDPKVVDMKTSVCLKPLPNNDTKLCLSKTLNEDGIDNNSSLGLLKDLSITETNFNYPLVDINSYKQKVKPVNNALVERFLTNVIKLRDAMNNFEFKQIEVTPLDLNNLHEKKRKEVTKSLLEQILEREKGQNKWKYLKSLDHCYEIQTETLRFKISVCEESNKVQQILMDEVESEFSVDKFLNRYIRLKIDNICLALGNSYDLMSLLDYIEMLAKTCNQFLKSFMLLNLSMRITFDENAMSARVEFVKAVRLIQIIFHVNLEDIEGIHKDSITIDKLLCFNQNKISELAEKSEKGFNFLVSLGTLLREYVLNICRKDDF